ncbi:hypothetical protein [Streptomyces misionensis]|uniref:hypothetical protein n=1 Tax=Streptomyces misionensis TaxID=67331 RepID=UPI0016494D07|nr:hypothetical protein [Streptomyces misionensis]
MGASEMYGTQRGAIAALLEAVGDSVMVLSYQEDRSFAAMSLDRFGAAGSVRLDWRGHEVIDRCDAFDGGQLRRTVLAHAEPGELAIVFWDNLAVPSVALEASLLADHAEVVEDVRPNCWIYLAGSAVLVERHDGEEADGGAGARLTPTPGGASRAARVGNRSQ